MVPTEVPKPLVSRTNPCKAVSETPSETAPPVSAHDPHPSGRDGTHDYRWACTQPKVPRSQSSHTLV